LVVWKVRKFEAVTAGLLAQASIRRTISAG
jgi:hypothetical protein